MFSEMSHSGKIPTFGQFVNFIEVFPMRVMDLLLGVFVRLPVKTAMSHLKEAAHENPRPLSRGLRQAQLGKENVSEAEDYFGGAAWVWGVICGGSVLFSMLIDAVFGVSFDLTSSVLLSVFMPFFVMGFVEYLRASHSRRKFSVSRNSGGKKRGRASKVWPTYQPLRWRWSILPVGGPILYLIFNFVIFR
ncbi:hypothetical protein [Streptomyces alkaliphilus]|uniref:hypothetical protein n=1 Tax=Streptomyces alkaliphilus TaxID=1472722 RepID=UPI00117D6FEC|nr:hypothetical protein [Streptomyces alkaliphilus]MQS06575.1 hypothetical protein [Streptomyces alkaliphilus]